MLSAKSLYLGDMAIAGKIFRGPPLDFQDGKSNFKIQKINNRKGDVRKLLLSERYTLECGTSKPNQLKSQKKTFR